MPSDSNLQNTLISVIKWELLARYRKTEIGGLNPHSPYEIMWFCLLFLFLFWATPYGLWEFSFLTRNWTSGPQQWKCGGVVVEGIPWSCIFLKNVFWCPWSSKHKVLLSGIHVSRPVFYIPNDIKEFYKYALWHSVAQTCTFITRLTSELFWHGTCHQAKPKMGA